MAISPTAATIAVGQTKQFTGTGTTNSGATVTGSATWASSNPAVATVDQNGLATAMGVGTMTITATVVTADGPVTGSATLTVTAPALTSITVTPANASMSVGSTQQFTATGVYTDHSQQTMTTVTWSSSATNVATISSTGMVTAVGAGSTTISASASGISASTGLTASSPAYVGTQSPGDKWLFLRDYTAKTFTATNTSPIPQLSCSGTLTALPNGFYKTAITASNDPRLPVAANGYALEVPGVALVVSLGGSTDKPIAAITPGPCPMFTSPVNVDVINLGRHTYDSGRTESFAWVIASQSGSDYDFYLNSYLLNGALRAEKSGLLPPGTCTDGVITIPNVPEPPEEGTHTVTGIAAPNGLFVLDLGRNSITDIGKGAAVGTTTPVGLAGVSAAMSARYLGLLFKRNSTPITSFVGFGPGSGTSITGGTFVNQDTDAFDAHGTNVTIDLVSADSNSFLQGTLTDSLGSHMPLVAVITQSAGKYYIFGLTTDIDSNGLNSPTMPYAVILVQQ
jgi:hypothetical protein